MSVQSQSELETRPRPAGVGAGSLLLPAPGSLQTWMQPAASGQLSQEPGRTPVPAHTSWILGSRRCPLLLKEPDISYRRPQLQLAVLRCSGFSSKCFQVLKWTLIAASCHTAGVAFPLSHLLEKSCVCSGPHPCCFGTGPTATSPPIPTCSSHPGHLILPKQSPAKAGFLGDSLCRDA